MCAGAERRRKQPTAIAGVNPKSARRPCRCDMSQRRIGDADSRPPKRITRLGATAPGVSAPGS